MSDILGTYLNHHHAGATSALALITHVIDRFPSHAGLLSPLRREIEADHRTLIEVMHRLRVSESLIGQASGWLGGHAAGLKLRFEGDAAFQLLEGLELLALGILGKFKLWTLLDELDGTFPSLAGMDFHALQQRALDQHDRVEAARIAAAHAAMSLGSPYGGPSDASLRPSSAP